LKVLNIESLPNYSIDCSGGPAYYFHYEIIKALKENNIEFNAELLHTPETAEVNENCGSDYILNKREITFKHKYERLVAHDGDGDRCVMFKQSKKLEILYGEQQVFY